MVKKLLLLPAGLALVLMLQLLTFADSEKSSTLSYLENLHNQGKERVIVRFEDQIDTNLVKKYQGKVIRKLKIIDAVVCEIDQDKIELLRQEKGIRDVVPDAVIKIPEPKRMQEEPVGEWEEPADFIIPTAYDGNATVRWNNLEAGLNSKAAWDNYNLDGNAVKIAILDTGINYTMENLDDNYLGGYDFVDDDNDPLTTDINENHGTKVSSLAVGEGVSKVVGVAYKAGFYAIRVLHGEEGTGYVSDAIAGIYWAMDPDDDPNTDDKADIINMSFGGYGSSIWKAPLETACNAAYAEGIVLVGGSGNDGYSYSAWPASFENVISTGAYGEDQTLYNYNEHSTNGGVDVIAPGARVATVKPDNSGWWVWGTSFAAPHASALIALQIQYARQNNIDLNNGYLWEVMKHSAHHLAGETYDPVYQGSGKIYAASTDINDANIGSIDLISMNWPIDYYFTFSDYAFLDTNYPVYQIGSDVNQTITLTNITDILGNTVETIEDLNVVATQGYYGDPNDQNLPGNSVEIFPTISLLEPNDANSITLSLLYTVPPETTPGLVKTTLELEFNFLGDSRVITVSYNEPNSLWYAAIPADLDLSNTVSLSDFSIFAENWQQTACTEPDWCGRADIDRNGYVDLFDLRILAQNWLTGL